MTVQIRIYTINKGELHQFATEWNSKIRPVREKLGFKILGAWTTETTNQFIWLLGYEGTSSFEIQDKAYFDSSERRTMDPNPARLIARIEQYFIDPVN
jgi:hypothetical protein